MRWTLRMLTAIVGFHVAAATAFAFDPHTLLSDEDMTGALFSRTQTISFLRSKSGYLAGQADEFGGLIYEAAVGHGLNPQFLIAQIQKESSLVEDPNPSQTRIDYALGFGCPDTSPCRPADRGFRTQVTKAAAVFRGYLDDLTATGLTVSGWGVGVLKRTGAPRNTANPHDPNWESLNGQPVFVTPTNAATAAMYTYNPWVGGHNQLLNGRDRFIGANYNFRLIWDRYFRNLRVYPDGSLLRAAGDATVWLVTNGVRKPFLSRAAFRASYDPRKVIVVPGDELATYERGPAIKFAEGSLLQAPNGGVYLISNGRRRPIVSRRAFRAVGFNPEEVVKASWDDLAAFPTGQPINEANRTPNGRLVQVPGGIVYVDEHDVKHPLYSKEILKSAFRHRRAERGSLRALAQLPVGDPVTFRDGELVTAPGAAGVYFISDGKKRPIPSPEIFTAYRFKWSNVIRTTSRALEAHATGEPLTLQS